MGFNRLQKNTDNKRTFIISSIGIAVIILLLVTFVSGVIFFAGSLVYVIIIKPFNDDRILKPIITSLPRYPDTDRLNIHTQRGAFPDTNSDYSITFYSKDTPTSIEDFYNSFMLSNGWTLNKTYSEQRPNNNCIGCLEGTLINKTYRKKIRNINCLITYDTLINTKGNEVNKYRISAITY